jgi:twinkle protein
MSIYLDQPLHLRPMEMDDPLYKEAYDATVGSDQVCFYDHWGSTESRTLLNKMRFMAVGLGCQWIVLDHISIVVSGDDSRDSERILLDRAMTNLGSLAREVNIGILVVCHLRKADGKPFEEGGTISLNHLRGTGGIAQLSNAVIALERNQQDDGSNVAIVRVLKDRFTGFTGQSGEVVYSNETGRLKDVDPYEEREQQEADSEF